MGIPEEVKQEVQQLLGKNGRNVTVFAFQPASGGCINNGGKITTSAGEYFIKWNSDSRLPGMFKAEARGLDLLNQTDCIKIPEVVGYGESNAYGWILLEHMGGTARKKNYWNQLGQELACLHRTSHAGFGLDTDNFIGSLPQKNSQLDNWVEFLITHRFEPMVNLARRESKIGDPEVNAFERLYGKLKGLLVYEDPSLLHGDLWSGNIMTDDHGSPVLIDPAVYYGHREVDLAFTTLFGGFDQTFYSSYQEEWPLESGYQERFDIYNLYPLMVHVNLFGGGYINQVKQLLSRFT